GCAMAVLEIQSNGDSRVSEEAIARARHSLDDPNMRDFILGCLLLNPDKRPTAHNLLFHQVLFEVHSLKLLAAHCFINNQYLMPENVVEEKTKELDLNMVMAEIRREGRPAVQWRYSEVSFLELDKFLEDVRNGIYPLMNFAATRPQLLPRALSQPQEDPQKAKTPTPEPFDVETRKVRAKVEPFQMPPWGQHPLLELGRQCPSLGREIPAPYCLRSGGRYSLANWAEQTIEGSRGVGQA
uniref:Nuclear receptor binding protein 2 n=1 Tax=Terrapene triunguis TaxID=2587831 RepID=A0A674K3E9_9SAUR